MDLSRLFEVRKVEIPSPEHIAQTVIERQVDLLLEFLQAEMPDVAGLDADIQAVLDSDRKIEAMLRYRQRYGADLADAKEAIESGAKGPPALARIELKLERVLRELGISSPDIRQTQDLDIAGIEQVKAEISRGTKIGAYKLYRDLTGADLKETVKTVDDIERRLKER